MIAQSVAEIISRCSGLTVEGIGPDVPQTFRADVQYDQGCPPTHRGWRRRFASYGLASHAAIINGKDSRKGRRGSRFQLKYRKTTPCNIANGGRLASMLMSYGQWPCPDTGSRGFAPPRRS